MGAHLELRGLVKQYPGHTALDGLSLEINEGEFFALLGPSGCGKTTTLRLIAGFEQPTRGEILLRGERLNGLPPYRRNVSTVFQSYALFPHLTVRENIEFGLRYRNGAAHRHAVDDCVEMLGLADKLHRFPRELSGGEKQRVALARSLVLRPEVLLLDEPLAALDPNLRKQVRAELRSLQRRVGITFVFVTHDREEALSLSDRIALLNAGRCEQLGAPHELYLRPRTRFAAAFLGPVNWIGGIGLRPEATRVAVEPPLPGAPVLPARVRTSLFLGNCLHVEAELDDGACVLAEVSRFNGAYQPGQRVYVFWRPEDEIRVSA
ncbi:MAG: ABC transporter ATP-binding protein [Bryobacteraceae bacterium]